MKKASSSLPSWQLWGARAGEHYQIELTEPASATATSLRPQSETLQVRQEPASFWAPLRAAVLGTLVLAVVCCGLYPLAVWGVAQLAFPHQTNGSLITGKDGTVRGSELIGQNFTAPKYFHSRPSAAGNGYDAANSGGSNLGPTSQKLDDLIKDRIAAYRNENGLGATIPIPADAVTASGSGLDPHISVRNAELQVARVARERHLAAARVQECVRQCTTPADLGFLGEPRVNVLKLNLLLDSLQ